MENFQSESGVRRYKPVFRNYQCCLEILERIPQLHIPFHKHSNCLYQKKDIFSQKTVEAIKQLVL